MLDKLDEVAERVAKLLAFALGILVGVARLLLALKELFMIRRPVKTRFNRRRPDPAQMAQPVDGVATPTIASGNVLLTFNVPVSLSGTPAITNEGVLPVGATRPTPTTVLLDYAAPVVSTDVLVIPANDPAIRTNTGGYAQALSYTFPA